MTWADRFGNGMNSKLPSNCTSELRSYGTIDTQHCEKEAAIKRAVIGILAHVDAGKTTLIESLLFRTGAVHVLGSVDEGNSHLDFHALERQRGITIYAKQSTITCNDAELTLIDTPGHVDFSSEAERTLRVLDYAVLVIDANDGVRGHTETLWRLLRRHHVPTIIFANKMDLSIRSRDEIMAELNSRLSEACLDFSGLKLDERGKPTEASLLPDFAEACASCDEQAIEEFLETSSISTQTLQRLVAQTAVFPVFFGAAVQQRGVDELAYALAFLAEARQYPTAFGARVFKISHDSNGERLTWLKVTGGSLEVKQSIEEPAQSGTITEKVNQIRRYAGEKFEAVPSCPAGSICAVTGLSHTQAGMTLGSLRNTHDDTEEHPALVPTYACGVILNGCDVQAVHNALSTLTDEDPLLDVRWDERLQELQVRIMGTIQLEILQATLHERFGLDVEFGPGGVLYRETIEEPVTGIGHFEPLRHYAEVHLLIEPLPRGSGLQFGTCCHVDELELNWQRLILTNAMERDHLGVLIGAPLTDARITLIGGRAHNKHTEGGDFRQATYRAIRQGLMQAHNILLEPWNHFTLRVPTEQVGHAFSDLQRMAARYDAPSTQGTFTCIEGIVPASEVGDYAVHVSSYTHGAGSLSLEFHGYERCHDEQAIIERETYDPEADLPNTPDSVFCAHGAGHTVKWNEVAAAAHVHPDPSTFTAWREATPEFFGKH